MKSEFLKLAIEKAENNISKGGGPFGAVIVKDGEIIAKTANRVTALNDPTAHAEILAIREAAQYLGDWNLEGCVLYSSCEPCPMCLGAIYWSHIDKVYYAGSHLDAREAGFDDSFIYDEIRKVPKSRKLEMIRLMHEEGRSVFQKWLETEDREEY